jgi:exosortase A
MSAIVTTPPRAALLRPGDTTVLATLAAGIVALLLLFRPEGEAAMRVWSGSTAYSHCWFVAPIALWLAWERRAEWAANPVRPVLWPALLAVPVALAWFAAERLGIMEGRQLTALTLLELLALGVLGWRMWWAFSAPLLYLFFLVPFGAFFVPALQDVTAWFVTTGLDLIGIPNYSDGYTIEITAGSFYVAEACAGLRFLIASMAFGVLYACLIYRSLARRAAFMAASVAIPIVANGLRGLGIVVLGDYLGSAEAAAADHLIYGWIFFSVVILLLILAGLPFREDSAAASVAPMPDRPRMPRHLLAGAAGAALAVAALGPLAAEMLDRAAQGGTVPPAFALETPASCVAGPESVAGDLGTRSYRCGGETLQARVETFAPHASPARLFAALRETAGDSGTADVAVSALTVPGMKGAWRLVETDEPWRLIATALWVDGVPVDGGLRDRARLALASFGAAGGSAPVLVSVQIATTQALVGKTERDRLVEIVRSFLAAQAPLAAQLAAR